MSKIGKQPIKIPNNISVEIADRMVVVKGPKGKLRQKFNPEIKIEVKDETIFLERKSETKIAKSLHGLYRTLIFNMIQGVSQGFSKILELEGTGYRVSKEGRDLKILVGYSHPVKVNPPEGIEFQVEDNKVIKVIGIDKQLVGQTAANIRKIRKPEPYKGKGIRYQGERIKIKPGKAAKAGAESS